MDNNPNRKYRVLMCSHDLKFRGAQKSLYELSVGLKKRGKIEPIIFSPSDGPLREAYKQNNIPVFIHTFQGNLRMSGTAFQNYITGITNFVINNQIDLIHANTLQSFYCIIAAKHSGIPCIWNVRESGPVEKSFSYLRDEVKNLALQCFEHTEKAVFVSNASMEVWSPLNSKDNFTVIHNALHPNYYLQSSSNWSKTEARATLGIAKNDIVIINVGTICERKGQLDLVHALMEMPKNLPNKIKVFIIGDNLSNYSKKIHQTLKRSPFYNQNNITIQLIQETENKGKVNDIINYYLAADMFVFNSRVESYPRVILEAMAFDLPIITTPVFGVKEQVVENENALFYKPGNINELKENIMRLVENEQLRQEFSINSTKCFQKLSTFEEMVAKYEQIILDTIHNFIIS